MIDINRFDSFTPIRFESGCKWFVDGSDFMHSLADSIQTAQKQILLSGFTLSPRIYLKRFNRKYCITNSRLDLLLKNKAVWA